MKNYGDLGGCYPPRPTASTDNTLLGLRNSSYNTQPHSLIVNKHPLTTNAKKKGSEEYHVFMIFTSVSGRYSCLAVHLEV